MKCQFYFALTCLLVLQNTFTCEGCDYGCEPDILDWESLREDELTAFAEDCILDGYTYTKYLQEYAIESKYGTCSANDCTVAVPVHAFKVASYASNVLSMCEGQLMLMASLIVKDRLNLTAETVPYVLPRIPISDDVCNDIICRCKEYEKRHVLTYHEIDYITLSDGKIIPACANNMYRTINGFCNNIKKLNWGASVQPFNRVLSPAYDDGLNAPRGFLNDNLPTPRAISRSLMKSTANNAPIRVTQMVKVWGQFLDHDITRTPETSAGVGENSETLKLACCEDGALSEDDYDTECDDTMEICDDPENYYETMEINSVPECLPILIEEDDPFFMNFNVSCLEFIRSAPANQGCKFGPREQFNEVTSFIDASNVYGSTKQESRAVRLFELGRLLTSMDISGNLTIIEETCSTDERHLYFLPSTNSSIGNQFRAGDTRSNEQPSLASMHTIWVRIHNRIAGYIQNNSPFLSDESIYQDARKIVIALMQHITYKEFLPRLLGNVALFWYHLREIPLNQFNRDYDENLDPTIFNAFGHAAFRFGHTLVTDNMAGETDFLLGDNFFRSSVLFQTSTTQPSSILKSEATMPAEPSDALLDDVLTTRLFFSALANQANIFNGSDLMSLNIQRGREHGLPSYLEWRRYCRLQTVLDFIEMRTIMDPQIADRFSELYDSVEDVDLFPAGLAETVLPGGGILGATFSCIIAQQFNRLKYGDRFFFDNGPFIHKNNPEIPFKVHQLIDIKNTTFAQLLCDVTCSDKYPVNVFKYEVQQPMLNCTDGEDAPIFIALANGSF